MPVVSDLRGLDPRIDWWVPAVTAPERGWRAAPAAHRGSRYLIDADTFAPALTRFPAFHSRADCLRWIMEHRAALTLALPHAQVEAVRLDRWMLGIDAV